LTDKQGTDAFILDTAPEVNYSQWRNDGVAAASRDGAPLARGPRQFKSS